MKLTPKTFRFCPRSGQWVSLGIWLLCVVGCGSKEGESAKTLDETAAPQTLPPLPSPNGYEMLLQAADNTKPLPSPVESMSRGGLEAYLASHDDAFAIVRSALQEESRVILDGASEFSEDHAKGQESLRNLVNLYLARAALAEGKVQMSAAMEAYLELLQIGIEVGRGGLESDLRLGIEVEEKARVGLDGLIRRLPKDAVKEGLEVLIEIHGTRPTPLALREWATLLESTIHSSLLEGLDDSQRQQRKAQWDAVVDDSTRQLSKLLGLLVRWSARAYEFEHGTLPETLSHLVPNLLSDVPIDPSTGQPFTAAVLK